MLGELVRLVDPVGGKRCSQSAYSMENVASVHFYQEVVQHTSADKKIRSKIRKWVYVWLVPHIGIKNIIANILGKKAVY